MSSTVKRFADRMRHLMEQQIETATDLRGLAKEMRDEGLSAANMKALVKALILDEQGDSKPLENLKAKIQDMALYAEALGVPVDGFGETKRFVSENGEPTEPASTEAAGLEAPPVPAMDEERSGSSSEAPHTCGAGEGDRPNERAALPIQSPGSEAQLDEQPTSNRQGAGSTPAGTANDDFPDLPACLRREKRPAEAAE